MNTLTARERQVFIRLARGRLNREIAEELGIGEKTVHTHRTHVRKKLGVRNNAEMALYAVRERIIDVFGNEIPVDKNFVPEGGLPEGCIPPVPSSNGAPCG